MSPAYSIDQLISDRFKFYPFQAESIPSPNRITRYHLRMMMAKGAKETVNRTKELIWANYNGPLWEIRDNGPFVAGCALSFHLHRIIIILIWIASKMQPPLSLLFSMLAHWKANVNQMHQRELILFDPFTNKRNAPPTKWIFPIIILLLFFSRSRRRRRRTTQSPLFYLSFL